MMDVARLGLEVDSKDVKSATTELDRLNRSAGDAERSATRFAQNFGRTMKQGAMVAGAAFTAAGAGIAFGVRRILNSADDLAKMSQRIGISVEELSRLRHAAELSGTSFEGMTSAVRLLSRNMDEAFSSGSGQAFDAFQRLGVDLADAEGRMKSSSEVMGEVADRFAAMEDGAEKTALAMQIFGRSGTDLIPMLNQGADALQRMKDEADELGLVITPEMAANAELFNDNLTRLQGVMTGLLTMVAADLAPVLADFTTWLVDMAKGFRDMDPWLQSAVTRFGVFAAVVAPLGAVLAVVVAGIAAIGVPVALAAAGITALTAAVVAFWPEIRAAGAAVLEFVSDAWVRFESAWDGIVDKVNETGEAVWQFAEDLLSTFADLPAKMLQVGIDIIQGLWDGIKAKWDEVKEGIASIPQDIYNSFTSFLGIQSPSTLMHEVGVNIMQGLHDGMSEVGESVVDLAWQVSDRAAEAFRSLADEAFRSVMSIGSDVFGLASQLTGAMSKMFADNKAFAIANAIVNTAQAITRTLAQYGATPWGLAAAGVAAASGAAQIAAISSANRGGGSRPNVSGGGGSVRPQQPQQQQTLNLTLRGLNPNQLYTGEQVRELAEALVEYQRDGGRLVLVEQ